MGATLSSRQLQRLFKKELGFSVAEYCRNVRMERATRLLRSTDLQVSEIAYDLGYSWPEHFKRDFKRFSGVTPTEYRVQNHQELT